MSEKELESGQDHDDEGALHQQADDGLDDVVRLNDAEQQAQAAGGPEEVVADPETYQYL